MFFPRLRKRAKWVFAFLALVFAVSFMFLGVGAGGSGIADYISQLFGTQSNATGTPSIDAAKAKVKVQAQPGWFSRTWHSITSIF